MIIFTREYVYNFIDVFYTLAFIKYHVCALPRDISILERREKKAAISRVLYNACLLASGIERLM